LPKAENHNRRRVKTVRIIARLNVGGPARHVVLANQGLSARGYDTLLVHGRVGPGEASLEHAAHDAELRVTMVPELGPRISIISDLVAFAKLLRVMFAESPDIVHTHTAKAGALGRVSAALFNATRARRRRAVVIHTFHGHVLSGYFGRAGNMAVRLSERLLALLTDWIVTISPRQKEEIAHRFGVAPASKIVVIPLGLDLSELLASPVNDTSIRDRLGISRTDLVFGFVGRFVAIKDLATLIRAFASAHTAVPSTHLMLFGDGPQRAELRDLARHEGIESHVHFVGWTEDLVSVYSAIDVCVLSSLNEGTPVALIEAMAAGRPVIATAVGGVPDVVDHGRTGMLVPSRDAAALGGAMAELASNAGLRFEMGRNGREDVGRRFSHLRLVEDLSQLYAAALVRKRGNIGRRR
jgi:glycosyltransferase involved in cell wall biosynthesis